MPPIEYVPSETPKVAPSSAGDRISVLGSTITIHPRKFLFDEPRPARPTPPES
jgi:hypothetical protein